MNKELKNFIQSAKKIKLLQAEKAQGKEGLVYFIKTHPVRNRGDVRHNWQRSFGFFNINFLSIKPMAIGLIIALIVSLSGGASYAAENSLPGDALHPLKLYVNEEVRGWLTFDEEKKADWEARRAERRLEEAEKLAVLGGLTEEIKEKIEARFEKHVERVEEHIARFQEREDFNAAADISSRFEASLKAHRKILERLEAKHGALLDSLAAIVEEEAENAEEEREESEEGVTTGPNVQHAAEGKMGALEHKIAAVEEFIEKKEGSEEATELLQDAKNTLEEGVTKLDEEEYGAAFRLFQKAHRMVQEAKLLVKAENDLDIDIPENEDGDDEEGDDEDGDDEDGDDEDSDEEEGDDEDGDDEDGDDEDGDDEDGDDEDSDDEDGDDEDGDDEDSDDEDQANTSSLRGLLKAQLKARNEKVRGVFGL